MISKKNKEKSKQNKKFNEDNIPKDYIMKQSKIVLINNNFQNLVNNVNDSGKNEKKQSNIIQIMNLIL